MAWMRRLTRGSGMFGVLVILTTCIASFTGVGVNGHYIIDTPSGCADVTAHLPRQSSVFRVDSKLYKFEDNNTCSQVGVPNDFLECSQTPDPSGGFIAQVRVCKVEKKRWVGFYVDDSDNWGFEAYITAYFSQGGTWANINRNCIQPQWSGPLEIKAGGLDVVPVVCARKMDCRMGKYTILMDDNGKICSDVAKPYCSEIGVEDVKMVRTFYKRPEGVDMSYVYCSTGDSFLSYAIDWVNSA
uniref:Secreted protein n=1 Tax=Mesocestoides corti TaxID=53468 RepID=A0A5K3F5W3_MESCO